MSPTVVFAALGANPAPLGQLVWALHRKWGWVARDVSAVVDARGQRYLLAEALASGSAWDALRAALGESCLDRSRLRVVPVYGDDGELLPSDEAPEDAARPRILDLRPQTVSVALVGGLGGAVDDRAVGDDSGECGDQ